MPIQKVLTTGKVPVKVWTEHVDSNALDQLAKTSTLPFLFHHVCAMPDVHLGIGATVGSVIATKDAVIPAAVGVDIGCGMIAMRLPYREGDLDGKLPAVRAAIEKAVPVGRDSHDKLSQRAWTWTGFNPKDHHIHADIKPDSWARAQKQLGTLGGGNHFIEVCLDESGGVWLMLHSGSRNIGKVIAEQYIVQAKALMTSMFIKLEDPHLAYFPKEHALFDSYVQDMHWAQSYAMENRQYMLDLTYHAIGTVLGPGSLTDLLSATAQAPINCHHNYMEIEHHYGENVYVTRKGAIRAREGDWGIIPGSMGARSFIVCGRGNAESFHSAPHGAGRCHSRGEAKRKFTVDDLRRLTEGVECRKDEGVLDEIPSAYKPIDQVMQDAADLVEIKHTLKQVVCVKG